MKGCNSSTRSNDRATRFNQVELANYRQGARDKGQGKYEQQFELSEEFQQQLKQKVRELLTEQEWRRRKMQMRISEEEGRLKKDEEETKEMWKRKREHEEQWEGTRENRVVEDQIDVAEFAFIIMVYDKGVMKFSVSFGRGVRIKVGVDKHECSVQEALNLDPTGILWNLDFHRNLNDWELDLVASLLDKLTRFHHCPGEDDKMILIDCAKGMFSVKTFYKDLEIPTQNTPLTFPMKKIWIPKLTSKVVFFAWTLVLNKAFTIDNLRKRNILIVNFCSMCKKDGESIDYLLLLCLFAESIWIELFTGIGNPWPHFRSVKELLTNWKTRNLVCHGKVLWRFLPFVVSSWRDFKKTGKKGKKGEIRPPKLKIEDPNKSYVQRPVKRG
ncbi:hypothetical protein GIB67_035380 [Kingdonia uniflora]|uniref:Reverse transcriptase zinc-binding domain-containing protein n=1 Tax=Kingdonia uniflora TaxID=39325 RepID=A0A7J7MMA2_9MAGN|nr:hypothetical protein GIB67_035380 [Kingdonia uniflora]